MDGFPSDTFQSPVNIDIASVAPLINGVPLPKPTMISQFRTNLIDAAFWDNILLVLYTLVTIVPTILATQLRNNPDYSQKTQNKIEKTITAFYFLAAVIIGVMILINIYLRWNGNKSVSTDRNFGIFCKVITIVYLIYVAVTKINPKAFNFKKK